MKRYHFLAIGIVLLFLGLHLNTFDSFVLSENATRFYVEKIEKKSESKPVLSFMNASTTLPVTPKVITPPTWIGWPFVSVGAVLIFQSFVLKRE